MEGNVEVIVPDVCNAYYRVSQCRRLTLSLRVMRQMSAALSGLTWSRTGRLPSSVGYDVIGWGDPKDLSHAGVTGFI